MSVRKSTNRIHIRPFWMSFPDPTAAGGVAKIQFDPRFDRVPSTGELVNTKEKGKQYWKEVCKV